MTTLLTPPMNANPFINAYVTTQDRDGLFRLVQIDAYGNERPERGVEHPVVNLVERP